MRTMKSVENRMESRIPMENNHSKLLLILTVSWPSDSASGGFFLSFLLPQWRKGVFVYPKIILELLMPAFRRMGISGKKPWLGNYRFINHYTIIYECQNFRDFSIISTKIQEPFYVQLFTFFFFFLILWINFR